MSLTVATLLPGILLLLLGATLLVSTPAVVAVFKGFPRSVAASYLFFGLGAAGFLRQVWLLSPADFGDYRGYLFVGFALLAALSIACVPDFLAVRGLAICILVGAIPLLDAAFMEYQYPQRLLMVGPVYLALAISIWLGAQPWRLRDFLEWLFRTPGRSRSVGGLLLAYGAALAVTAFTY